MHRPPSRGPWEKGRDFPNSPHPFLGGLCSAAKQTEVWQKWAAAESLKSWACGGDCGICRNWLALLWVQLLTDCSERAGWAPRSICWREAIRRFPHMEGWAELSQGVRERTGCCVIGGCRASSSQCCPFCTAALTAAPVWFNFSYTVAFPGDLIVIPLGYIPPHSKGFLY